MDWTDGPVRVGSGSDHGSEPNRGKPSSVGCNGFGAWGYNYCFAQAVNDYEKGVVSIGEWEIRDEVHGDDSPDRGGDLVWLQGYLCTWSYFGDLAGGASVYEVPNKSGHSWPPEFPGDEFVGFPSPWVARGYVFVVCLHDISS